MSFILGYIAGISTFIAALVCLVLVAKAKKSYEDFKRK
jgi:hypothetical protein